MALSFINTSGNIISEDFCQLLLSETKADYVKSKSFGADVKKVDEDIATTYELLHEKWEEIRVKVLENQFDNSQLRDKWIKPFFSLLGFDMTFVSHNFKNNAGVEYHIPYKGWNTDDAPLIHMVHSSADLDSRDRTNRTHPNKSPHDLLQQFLNTSPHKWAILTNGRRIRVLRDFFHSITKGFIEFDVESIFESASTEQFRILYRLLHKSRFIGQYETKEEDAEETICLLEKFHTLSRDTGVKVGENLRKQVRIAIETLGNGFAENIDPDSLNEAEEKKFYSEILNIIYRLLFLLFAEQKGWLPVKNDVYARTYSINYLREKAEKGEYNFDNNEDLWEGLKITFKLVTNGYSFPDGDKINAFGGLLFSDEHINHIKSPLKNRHLLKAIDALCFFTDNNIRNKINYAALAIDELGSVYESLLDYEPKLLKEDISIEGRPYHRGEFILDDRSTERKTSGSFYTDSRLVSQLIDSALVPVIENAIKDKTIDEDKRTAILNLKIADIACGSGAFLIAALEKLGEYLALIGKDEGEKPTEDELRQAKRDIMQNCIYGVDLNPMAVELAKFSLWITASMPNLPLSFLDHKLKCGNSLIGAIPELIKKGVPSEAYNPVTLDNSELCSQLKKRVKKELEGYDKEGSGVQALINFKVSALIDTDEDTQQYLHILHSRQENVTEVDNLVQEYEEVYHALRENIDWKLADAWTAAFFIRKDDINKTYPTNLTLKEIAAGNAIDEDLETEIAALARKYKFFHWHLEFPEVFEKGGFDCILGNPPWEKLQLEEGEFFGGIIDNFKSYKGQKRKRIIFDFLKSNINFAKRWNSYKRTIKCSDNFIKYSKRYPLTGSGKLNLYAIFAENFLQISNSKGYYALIAPTGLVTDFECKEFFKYVMESNKLKAIFEFVNEKKIFQAVAPPQRFCVFVTGGKGNEDFTISIGNREIETIVANSISINKSQIQKLNPNTFTLPLFSSKQDLEINIRIYNANRILYSDYGLNVYDISINRMINPTDDSDLFRTKEELLEKGFQLKELISPTLESEYFPVLEAKQIHQYNHRYNSYEGIDKEKRFGTKTNTYSPSKEKLSNPNYEIEPRYWISKIDLNSFIKGKTRYSWIIGFRDITNITTNRRTTICSIIPLVGMVDPLRCIYLNDKSTVEDALLLLSNLNSFVFDYCSRQKLSGSHLAIFILKQLPIIPKEKIADKVLSEIIQRAFELSYTSRSLDILAEDMNRPTNCFIWNETTRFIKQCEIDVIYAHLYGLKKVELDYILETFPIVKRKDIDKFGHYRTKETILQLYDEFAWVKKEI